MSLNAFKKIKEANSRYIDQIHHSHETDSDICFDSGSLYRLNVYL
jgi:hypothetical protein